MPEYTESYEQVLEEGAYDFTVVDAGLRTSEKKADGSGGNEMIELQLMVSRPGMKQPVRVFDHLVFTPSAYWKIDAFRVSTGEKLSDGKTASFEPEDCIDRAGRLWLVVDTYKGRARNRVGEYLDPAAEKLPPQPSAAGKDDINLDS